jgi:hypothetical protein
MRGEELLISAKSQNTALGFGGLDAKTQFAQEMFCTQWCPDASMRVSGIRGPLESHEDFPVPADRVAVEHAECSSFDTSPLRRSQTEQSGLLT